MKLWHKLGASVLLTSFAAVAPPQFAQAQSVIKIDGSSTVFPIAEAVAEEFQISKKGKVRVTVGIAGTGGGFKLFCSGIGERSASSVAWSTSIRTRSSTAVRSAASNLSSSVSRRM